MNLSQPTTAPRSGASLIIGIDDYADAPLGACVNDAIAINEALRVVAPHVAPGRTVLNKNGTRAGILNGLEWLAQQPVDVAFLYYSGHGTQVPDLNGDEKSGFDQALVPIDYATGGVVLDDQLREIFGRFQARKIVAIFDCCHSGRNDRSFAPKIGQDFWRYATGRKRRSLDRKFIPAETLAALSVPRFLLRNEYRAENPRLLHLSACSHDQVAEETEFQTPAGRTVRHGALTWYLLEIWRELATGAQREPARYILDELKRRVKRGGFAQAPQLASYNPSMSKQPLF